MRADLVSLTIYILAWSDYVVYSVCFTIFGALFYYLDTVVDKSRPVLTIVQKWLLGWWVWFDLFQPLFDPYIDLYSQL